MRKFRIGHQGLKPSSVDFGDVPVTGTHTKQVLVDNLMGGGPVEILDVSLTTSRTTPHNNVLLTRYSKDGKSKSVTVPMDGQGI